MTTVTETAHPGEYILSEGNGAISRETVTLTGGSFPAGQVLGLITIGTATAAGAAVASNTGGGTITATPAVSAGAVPGVYRATCIEPASGGGLFDVEDPTGVSIGPATTGAEFAAGGLTFTIADGTPDFSAGDAFTITVTPGATAGSYTDHDPDAIDGSQVAAAILYAAVDASSADAPGVISARLTEVNDAYLTWADAISAGEKTAAIAALAAHDIIVR
jgi:hypothetical protein